MVRACQALFAGWISRRELLTAASLSAVVGLGDRLVQSPLGPHALATAKQRYDANTFVSQPFGNGRTVIELIEDRRESVNANLKPEYRFHCVPWDLTEIELEAADELVFRGALKNLAERAWSSVVIDPIPRSSTRSSRTSSCGLTSTRTRSANSGLPSRCWKASAMAVKRSAVSLSRKAKPADKPATDDPRAAPRVSTLDGASRGLREGIAALRRGQGRQSGFRQR